MRLEDERDLRGRTRGVLRFMLLAAPLLLVGFANGDKFYQSDARGGLRGGDAGAPGYPVRIVLDDNGFGLDSLFRRPAAKSGAPGAVAAGTEAQGSEPVDEADEMDKAQVPASPSFQAENMGARSPELPARLSSSPALASSRFIELSFSLPERQGRAGAVDVQKMARFNGVDRGKVELRIAADTAIMIKKSDLTALLGDALSAEVATSLDSADPADGFVAFDVIRAAGIDVRYDAVHDRIVLLTNSGRS